jgi:hypothetical protein
MSEILTQEVTRRNPSAEEIIRALGGNPENGMCLLKWTPEIGPDVKV